MTEGEAGRALDRLLDVAWRSIAASGWNRYQLHGRGALLASIHTLHGRSNSMDYLTPSDNAPLPEWIESAISSYNPNASVVLVFVEDDVYRRATGPVKSDLLGEHESALSGPAFFRIVTRTPPPPECARRLAN
jgi:hypothetical protein